MSGFDLSSSMSLISAVQADMEERNQRMLQVAESAYNERQKMMNAIEKTAANTGETNDYLRKVVENQNAYIDLLNQQIEAQKQIIEKDKEQLQLLESIFVSSENGVLVEKEILQLIEDQIDSTHPLWDFVKEKGGDVLVNSATTGLPIIFNAIKLYLISKGINIGS